MPLHDQTCISSQNFFGHEMEYSISPSHDVSTVSSLWSGRRPFKVLCVEWERSKCEEEVIMTEKGNWTRKKKLNLKKCLHPLFLLWDSIERERERDEIQIKVNKNTHGSPAPSRQDADPHTHHPTEKMKRRNKAVVPYDGKWDINKRNKCYFEVTIQIWNFIKLKTKNPKRNRHIVPLFLPWPPTSSQQSRTRQPMIYLRK